MNKSLRGKVVPGARRGHLVKRRRVGPPPRTYKRAR